MDLKISCVDGVTTILNGDAFLGNLDLLLNMIAVHEVGKNDGVLLVGY